MAHTLDYQIGKRLRARRKALSFSAKYMASLLRCSQRLYYLYENGERPLASRTLPILGEALGVEACYFLEGLTLMDKPDTPFELATPAQRNPRLLFVNENAADQFILHEAIHDLGLDVDVYFCTSAEEADDFLKETFVETPIDIMLIDTKLPKQSGIGFVQSLRKNPRFKHTPLIIFTNDYTRRSLDQAIESGATSYVIKSPVPTVMRQTLSGILAYWCDTALLKTRDDAHHRVHALKSAG